MGGRFSYHMEWIATLGGMIKYGTWGRASCRKCDADLNKLIKAIRPAGSLLDRHPPCWEPGCEGRVMFFASPRKGTWAKPCMTP